MSTIRLMSHNVWNCDNNQPAWVEKGENCSAANRVGGLVQTYIDTLPDIIGGQEFSALMADLIKERAHEAGLEYTLIWGRYTPILYRADKFELLDSQFLTYPETIEQYEGIFNDSKSKAYNIGVFREKASGKIFVFATTHLWWKASTKNTLTTSSGFLGDDVCTQPYSDEAREYQVGLLAEKMKELRNKYNCPLVLVGDFNTDYNSKAIAHLFDMGFRHAHDIATDFVDETVGYHSCFTTGYENFYSTDPFEKSIDHILLLGEKEGSVKNFVRYSPDYYFTISDHSPTYIDFEL